MSNFSKFEINKQLEIPKLKMVLYKNKKDSLGKIVDYFNVKQELTMGEINKLTFSIPQYIDKDNLKTINPIFKKIRGKQYVKLTYNNIEERYYVKRQVKNSDTLMKDVQLESTAGLLANIDLYDYRVVSFTIENICNGNTLKKKEGILENTTWSLGHIDESLKNKKRGIEINGESNVLNAIFQIAKQFNAIIEWDTINEIVNFYDEEIYGKDKGLVFQYNKYLESITEEEDVDEMVTVLNVKGKDGLTINSLNPTGKSTLVDYSYFIYPFERDEKRNVLKHSNYMSDSLCHALLDFDNLVNQNKGKLAELLKKKIILEESLTIKEMQLRSLQGELEAIESKLSIAQTNNHGQDKYLKEKEKKLKNIEQQKEQVKIINEQKESIEYQLGSIKYLLSEDRNFTYEQQQELKDYYISRSYNNDNITDAKELIMAAQEDFQKLKVPKQSININIINFLTIVEAQKDWDKLIIGDIVTINYHRFNLDKVKARIKSISIDHNSDSIELEISTISWSGDKKDIIAKTIYNSASASAIVSNTRYDLDNVSNTVNELQNIISEAWKAGQRQIIAGANDETIINHLGLTSWDKDNKNNGIRINNGCLQVTNEGDKNFQTIINGNGLIDAGNLTGTINKDNVDLDINTDDVYDGNGNSMSDIIGEINSSVVQQANEWFDYIDQMEEAFGNRMDVLVGDMDDNTTKINQTNKDITLLAKETTEKYAAINIRANAIEQMVKNDEENFRTYRIQTDRAIADKVESEDFKSYRLETDRLIADKVDSDDFESYRTQTDRDISDIVRDKAGKGDIYSIIKQSPTAVEYAFNDISTSVTIDRYGLELGSGCRIACDAINSTNVGEPIIRLFGSCSLDATYNNERGKGDSIRLKWDRANYVMVESGAISYFIHGTRQFQVATASADGGGWCNPNFTFKNDMRVLGTKQCVHQTEHFGKRGFYAYEDCECYLTDRKTGEIKEENKRFDGLYEKYITFDKIYKECVNLEMNYNVGIYKYGKGDIWSEDLSENGFKVVSERPIKFTYIIEGKRKGFENLRNEQYLEN